MQATPKGYAKHDTHRCLEHSTPTPTHPPLPTHPYPPTPPTPPCWLSERSEGMTSPFFGNPRLPFHPISPSLPISHQATSRPPTPPTPPATSPGLRGRQLLLRQPAAGGLLQGLRQPLQVRHRRLGEIAETRSQRNRTRTRRAKTWNARPEKTPRQEGRVWFACRSAMGFLMTLWFCCGQDFVNPPPPKKKNGREERTARKHCFFGEGGDTNY